MPNPGVNVPAENAGYIDNILGIIVTEITCDLRLVPIKANNPATPNITISR